MKLSNTQGSNLLARKVHRKRRKIRLKKTDAELIQLFWAAPLEAYFDQLTIAPVTGRTPKTLECDRWKKSGIPFRKVAGRVLYQKRDVVNWLESHQLVTSTSDYKQEKNHE